MKLCHIIIKKVDLYALSKKRKNRSAGPFSIKCESAGHVQKTVEIALHGKSWRFYAYIISASTPLRIRNGGLENLIPPLDVKQWVEVCKSAGMTFIVSGSLNKQYPSDHTGDIY